MSGGVRGVSSQNILDGWIDVSAKPAENAEGVKIKTREIDVDNRFVLKSASKLDHPAPVRSYASQGVQRLTEVARPPSQAGDMSTVRGARDTLATYCDNFRATFVDRGLQARLDLLAEKVNFLSLDNSPDGRKAFKKAVVQLKTLQMRCAELKAVREEMLAYFPKGRTGPERNLNVTDDYLDKQAAADLAEMRTAVRNFRYDYDRFNADGNVSAGRKLGQFFSTTRNKFFRFFAGWESNRLRGDRDLRTDDEHRALHAKQQVPTALFVRERQLSTVFYELESAFSNSLGLPPDPPTLADFGKEQVSAREQFSADLLRLEEAVRTKNGDAPLSHAAREQLMHTLKEIGDPQKGGFKRLALTATVGGTLPLPVSASLSAKYKYCLDISSIPGGGIRIARVHSAGLQADIDANAGGVAKLKGRLEGGVEKGTVLTFNNYEEAVRELSSGRFKAFINGMWTGGVGLETVKIPLKFADRLFGQRNDYNENSFLRHARNRGYLEKADKVLAPGENPRVASRQKTYGAGGGASFSTHLRTARMKFELAGKGSLQFNTVKTEFRSFFTYFRSERKGEAKRIYLARVGEEAPGIADPAANERSLEDVSAVRTLLAKPLPDPETIGTAERAEMRARVQEQLLNILDGIIAVSDRVNDELAAGKKYTDDMYRDVAGMFPQATAAAQSLIEMLEVLSKDVPEAERKETENLVSLVEQGLTNPPIKFPQAIFERTFNVLREHVEGNVHGEGDFRFSYDLATLQDATMLTEGPLASTGTYATGSTGEKIALGLRRAAASGVSNVATNLLARSSSVSVHVSHDRPKTTDPRPWRQHSVTTLDVKLMDNLPMKLIYALIMKAVTETVSDEKSGCAEAGLTAKGLATAELSKFLSGSLTRAYYDITGKEGADEAIKAGTSVLAESVLDDYVWESMKNIRLTIEDGTLSSVSFGDATTMRIDVCGKVGSFRASAGFDYQSLVNTRTLLNKPTFATLAGYCDAYLRHGNRTAWKESSALNREAFLHMFGTLAGRVDTKEEEKSLKEFTQIRQRMRDEIRREGDPAMRRRLERCQRDLDEAIAKLLCDAARPLPSDKKRAAAAETERIADVRAVLEAVTRYFDVYEDRSAGIVSLASLHDQRPVELENINIGRGDDWTIIRP